MTGSTIFTFGGHSLEINAVAWSPDGSRIASGGVDNTVQVWLAE
jgi:WD40 repeat protein